MVPLWVLLSVIAAFMVWVLLLHFSLVRVRRLVNFWRVQTDQAMEAATLNAGPAMENLQRLQDSTDELQAHIKTALQVCQDTLDRLETALGGESNDRL